LQRVLFGHFIVSAFLKMGLGSHRQEAPAHGVDWRRAQSVLAEILRCFSFGIPFADQKQHYLKDLDTRRDGMATAFVAAMEPLRGAVEVPLDNTLCAIVEKVASGKDVGSVGKFSEEEIVRTWFSLHRCLSLNRDRIVGHLAELEASKGRVVGECSAAKFRTTLEQMGPPRYYAPYPSLASPSGGAPLNSPTSGHTTPNPNLLSPGGSGTDRVLLSPKSPKPSLEMSSMEDLERSGSESPRVFGFKAKRRGTSGGGVGGAAVSGGGGGTGDGISRSNSRHSLSSPLRTRVRSSSGSLEVGFVSVEQETATALSITQRLAQYADQVDKSSLAMEGCGMQTLPDFSTLTQVKKLDLSHNHLTKLPTFLFQMTQLEDLNLSHNAFESLPVRSLVRLPRLEKLDVSKNPFPNPLNYITSGVEAKNTLHFLKHISEFVSIYKASIGEIDPSSEEWNLQVERVLRSFDIRHLLQWSRFSAEFHLNSGSGKHSTPRFGRFSRKSSASGGPSAVEVDQILDRQVIATSERIAVFKNWRTNVTVTNATVGKVNFVCRIPKSALVHVECTPSEFSLPKGKSQVVEVCITFFCTTTLQDYVCIQMQPLGVNLFVFLSAQSDMSFELDAKEIVIGEKIGAGGAAAVFQGKWRGMEVACKKILGSEEDESAQQEAKLLCNLRHKNILIFYGMAKQDGVTIIVTELCKKGSLHEVLTNKEKYDLPFYLRGKFIFQTAEALEYLHSNSVIHRDVKSSNLLVSSMEVNCDSSIKLCDFGIARTVDVNMTLAQGTSLWMAPEVFQKQPYSTKADIWSFGIVMGEVALREEPFHNMSFFDALSKVGKGEVDPLPEGVPTAYAKLHKLCLRLDPNDRPDAKKVLQVASEFVKYPEMKLPESKPKELLLPSGGGSIITEHIVSGEDIKNLFENWNE
jgi:hypothetical protein